MSLCKSSLTLRRFVALALVSTACAVQTENTGVVQSALGSDTDVSGMISGINSPLGGFSTSATAVGVLPIGGGYTRTNVIAGYTTIDGFTSVRVAGWALSQNNGLSYPIQYDEFGLPWTGFVIPFMSDGSPYLHSDREGAVLGTGWDNQVAYFTPAVSAASATALRPAMDIVVAVSTDAGVSFNLAANSILSDQGSSGAAVAGGFVYSMAVTLEKNAPTHVAWVTWENVRSDGSPKSWIRRVHFHADGTFDLGPITEVRIDCNLNCVWLDHQNIAAQCQPGFQFDNCSNGVSPGTETLVITFPRVNEGGTTNLRTVQASKTCAQTINVEWRAAISTNAGVTWKKGTSLGDGSVVMASEPAWPNCIVPSAPAFEGNNRGRMPTVSDPGFIDPTPHWHVYYMRNVFSCPGPSLCGQRIFHFQFASTDIFGTSAEEELAPIQGVNPTCDPALGPTECMGNQFMPAADNIVNGNGPGITTYAVTWYDTRLDPNTPKGTIWGAHSSSNGLVTTYLQNQVATTLWAFTGVNGDTPWGHFQAVGTDAVTTSIPPPTDFFPVWGDNRKMPPTITRAYATIWHNP